MVFLLCDDGERRPAAPPFKGADHAVADGACPHCGDAPFKVAGRNMRPSEDDRAYEADAVALCCRERVGTLRAEPSTLFGVREDERVLRGRCRVY